MYSGDTGGTPPRKGGCEALVYSGLMTAQADSLNIVDSFCPVEPFNKRAIYQKRAPLSGVTLFSQVQWGHRRDTSSKDGYGAIVYSGRKSVQTEQSK